MRAVVINASGGVDTLEVAEVQDPVAGDGEVLIEVAYAGCNWADSLLRSGIYPYPYDFPIIPGFEVSGTVLEVGAGVDHVAIGDKVTAIPYMGGYAEKCVVEAAMVTKLPDVVGLDVGAAFPIQALTAYHMLHTVYNIKKDDWVLLHAAGGGVGLMVIQMAVKAGARVIGTVGTRGKEVKALSYGAARVVNLNDGDFVEDVKEVTEGRGVDLVIDSLGAETLDHSFEAVKVLGHVINIGDVQGEFITNIRERILPTSAAFTRFSIRHAKADPVIWKRGMDFVLNALAEGWLEAPIVNIYPLDNVRDMHRQIESRQTSGKLLLAMR